MKPENHPLVSVIMTSYNAARYIQESVGSILNQTFRDFEFVIVDNNSSDGTSDIIRSFRDSRIRLIVNPENFGQTRALNIAMDASLSPYLARMDADDVAMPQRIEKQLAYLKMHANVAVVGSWCLDIDPQGNPLGVYKVPVDSFWIRCCLAGSGELTSWCMTHPSVMMRREALMQAGRYHEEKSLPGYPQDYELWMRMIRCGDFANIGEPLLKYRILPASESKAHHEKTKAYCMDITVNKIRQYLPSLSAEDQEVLAQMLECRLQKDSQAGERVLQIFDRYFIAYMGQLSTSPKFQIASNKIKSYYLPMLSKTNPLLSLKEFFRIILRHPSIVFDVKLYRKFFKCLLQGQASTPLNSKLRKHFRVYR